MCTSMSQKLLGSSYLDQLLQEIEQRKGNIYVFF